MTKSTHIIDWCVRTTVKRWLNRLLLKGRLLEEFILQKAHKTYKIITALHLAFLVQALDARSAFLLVPVTKLRVKHFYDNCFTINVCFYLYKLQNLEKALIFRASKPSRKRRRFGRGSLAIRFKNELVSNWQAQFLRIWRHHHQVCCCGRDCRVWSQCCNVGVWSLGAMRGWLKLTEGN